MSQYESLQTSDKDENQLLDEKELQGLLNAVDTEAEAALLFSELETTTKLRNLKKSLIESLQMKILNGDEKALGLFRSLRSLDKGTPNIFLQKIQNALETKINTIEFLSVCSILGLTNAARTEYGIKLLVNKIDIKTYTLFFAEIKFLLAQFNSNVSDLSATQMLIQAEGIIALGKIANGETINNNTILEKYRILFARKQSLYYLQDNNKEYYEIIKNKSLQLQTLYIQLQDVKKEMSDAAKKRPGALTEALSRGVVPLLGRVLQGYKLKRKAIDAATKVLLEKHDAIIQSIKDIELTIQRKKENIKKNNLVGILYQFRAITEANKGVRYPTTYDNTTDREATLSLIRTDPGLQYLNSMYESMGMDFIRLLNTKTTQVLGTEDAITGEEILYTQNLKNGISLFESFHSYGVARETKDIATYAEKELGVLTRIQATGLGEMNEQDVIQSIQLGKIQTIKEVIDPVKKTRTLYGTVETEREHLAYLENVTGEKYIQQSLDELSSGKTPIIYIRQQTDNAGNTTLAYSVQPPFGSSSFEEIPYTDITSEKVSESNSYLIGLDKALSEYGNSSLKTEFGLLQTAMDDVNPLFELLGNLEGGTGLNTAKGLQNKVTEVNKKIKFASLLQTCTTLKNEGLPYLEELQRVFNERKGAILTPAEKAFQKKLYDLITVCKNALTTYQSLYDLLKEPEKIQPNTLEEWFITNGIPMLIAIGAAVAAIAITVSTFGIGSGVGAMVLTAGIGTAAGMVGNEIGHYASTKVGQSVYGDTYGNYTMFQKWLGDNSSYDGRDVAKQYSADFVQGFTMTLMTLGLARGAVSSIQQQALQPGVLGNGARRLVNLLRSDQELFTKAGHGSFMKRFGKEYLEELGEEGVGNTAQRIDPSLGFIAEVLINSKIQPNFIVDGKSASIQSTETSNGKKVTISCDGETFLENGEKHYLELGYQKSISKAGTIIFTQSITNTQGETYTHSVELVSSPDPYIVREINAVINPSQGYVIKMGDNGTYTVEDTVHSGNAIERHLPAIIALANQKGMIVSDLGNGDISIRFGNQEVIIKNSQEALQQSRIEKIVNSIPKLSPEEYFKSIRSRPNQGPTQNLIETNDAGRHQQIIWKWGITTDSRGMRYASVLLQSADSSGLGLDTCYFSSFHVAVQNKIREQIINEINTNTSEDLYIFIKDTGSVGSLPIYNIPLTSTEQAVENKFRRILGRRQVLTMCSEYDSWEHKQIILKQFGFTADQTTFLKTQSWFYNPEVNTQADTETTVEKGPGSHAIAQELDKEEVQNPQMHLLGGVSAVWENMTNDEQRTTTAIRIVNGIALAPGAYSEEQIQVIGVCVQTAHVTANNDVERNVDGTISYLYDQENISIPNRTLRGLRLKLDILKNGLSSLKKSDETPLFTDKQVSEIAKQLMRSGVCAEPVGKNNPVESRIKATLNTKGEYIKSFEKIGSGGNGTVYLVTTINGKTLAMKVIDAAGSEAYYSKEIARQHAEWKQVKDAGIPTFTTMEIDGNHLTVTTEYVAGAFDPLNDSIGTREFKKRGITREQLEDVSQQLDTIFQKAEESDMILSEADVFFFVYDSTTDTYKVMVGDYDNVGQDLGTDSEEVKRSVIRQLLPNVVEKSVVGQTSDEMAGQLNAEEEARENVARTLKEPLKN